MGEQYLKSREECVSLAFYDSKSLCRTSAFLRSTASGTLKILESGACFRWCEGDGNWKPGRSTKFPGVLGSGRSLDGGVLRTAKLFSNRAKVAQLLFVADCDRFGGAEKITLADIRFPVHRRAMYFILSIAITTRITDLSRSSCDCYIEIRRINDFLPERFSFSRVRFEEGKLNVSEADCRCDRNHQELLLINERFSETFATHILGEEVICAFL